MTANKKSKPVIQDIIISDEKMNQLNAQLRKKQTQSKPSVIRKFAGGTCTYCGEIPSRKLLYNIGDGDKLIEFYCEKCFEKHKSELDKRLQNINFT